MTVPIRIQRRRTKGWKIPLNTVYVGRPTKWSNPWDLGVNHLGECGHGPFIALNHQSAVDMYRWWITASKRRINDLHELRGKNLACWCPLDQPCHADVLLEMANASSKD